jgi:serine/threonine protein kinase
VIKFIEMIQSQNNLYLIYEYCKDGTLEEYLNKQKRRQLSEEESIGILK